MMRAGGMSEGRDIGVVFNLPRREGACVLPVCGGVGTQYTPAVGWAQALRYRSLTLGDADFAGSIAVAHGGDASTATNGFWAALNVVTTERLPYLFFIEDNGYGISVPSQQQTPGGNIARNLAAFGGLRVLDGDGSDPLAAAALIEDAVAGVRSGDGPALLRLTVPRLSGHSGQDTQAYKSAAEIAAERERDPLQRLRAQLVPAFMSSEVWEFEMSRGRRMAISALETAEAGPAPDPARVRRFLFSESRPDGSIELQQQGGVLPDGFVPPPGTPQADPQGPRINLVTAVRRTLQARTRSQSSTSHLWRGRWTQGRRARRHVGTAGEIRRCASIRHQLVRGRHHRPGRGYVRRRTDAGARDSIPKICRSSRGATQ